MRRFLFPLCLALVLAACGDREPSSSTSGLSDLGALQQLGYTDSVAADQSFRPQGVVVHREEAVAPGLTMMTVHRGGRAFLLDEAGEQVHEWVFPSKVWGHAQLLEDGSILVPAINEENPTLLHLSWDSEVLFQVKLRSHHDADRREDGRFTTLSFDWRSLPAFTRGDAAAEVRDEFLVVLDQEGAVLEEHSMIDMLASDPNIFTFKDVEIRKGDGKKRKDQLDLLHANSLYWMRREDTAKHPLFAVGNVLVSMRHQDRMVIVRPESGKVLWSWGLGELSGPHDATVLANGHLMIFDNGLEARRSRAVEVDPSTNEIVWEWQAPAPEDIFTIARGSSQRLDNGNTLLLNSDSGHALEVTAEGEVVWEYFHPVVEGRVASLVRAQRYPRSAFPQLEEGP